MNDDGLFGPGSVTWRLHVEPILWIGGVRALYLQALHPVVMRGTYQNSVLFDRKRAWKRFLRTVHFVAIRSYGTCAEVEAVAARVRAAHAALTGFDPDTGRLFRLDDPEALAWVHCAEIGSYLDVARRSGAVTDSEADRYVAENRAAARIIGITAPMPSDQAELAGYFGDMRARLRVVPEARRAVLRSFLPPMPVHLLPLRLTVPAINALAFASLPGWARWMYGVPALPGTDTVTTGQLRAIRLASRLVNRADTAELIERSRRDAHAMADGSYRSIMDSWW